MNDIERSRTIRRKPDRRSEPRDYCTMRRAEDRKKIRAIRVRRCMDVGYLPRVQMQEGYE